MNVHNKLCFITYKWQKYENEEEYIEEKINAIINETETPSR